MVVRLAFFAIAGIASAACAVAQSQEGASADGDNDDKTWEILLGAGVQRRPDYEGSDDFRVRGGPFISIEYRDLIFLRGGDLGANLLRIDTADAHFRAGPIVRYNASLDREENDNTALRGLGDIDPAVEAGAFASFEQGPWSISFAALSDTSDTHNGLYAQLESEFEFMLTARLGAEIGAFAMWADEDYLQTSFGITPAQSLNSGLRAYQPNGGIKDVGLSFALRYTLTRRWILRSGVELTKLQGDAAESPLVTDQGSENQLSVSLAVIYAF